MPLLRSTLTQALDRARPLPRDGALAATWARALGCAPSDVHNSAYFRRCGVGYRLAGSLTVATYNANDPLPADTPEAASYFVRKYACSFAEVDLAVARGELVVAGGGSRAAYARYVLAGAAAARVRALRADAPREIVTRTRAPRTYTPAQTLALWQTHVARRVPPAPKAWVTKQPELVAVLAPAFAEILAHNLPPEVHAGVDALATHLTPLLRTPRLEAIVHEAPSLDPLKYLCTAPLQVPDTVGLRHVRTALNVEAAHAAITRQRDYLSRDTHERRLATLTKPWHAWAAETLRATFDAALTHELPAPLRAELLDVSVEAARCALPIYTLAQVQHYVKFLPESLIVARPTPDWQRVDPVAFARCVSHAMGVAFRVDAVPTIAYAGPSYTGYRWAVVSGRVEGLSERVEAALARIPNKEIK